MLENITVKAGSHTKQWLSEFENICFEKMNSVFIYCLYKLELNCILASMMSKVKLSPKGICRMVILVAQKITSTIAEIWDICSKKKFMDQFLFKVFTICKKLKLNIITV